MLEKALNYDEILPAYIIEEIRKREEEKRDNRPRIYVPATPMPEKPKEKGPINIPLFSSIYS